MSYTENKFNENVKTFENVKENLRSEINEKTEKVSPKDQSPPFN